MKSKIGTVFFIVGAGYFILAAALMIIQDSHDFLAILGALYKPAIFFAAGLLMKLLSETSNFMNSQKGYVRSRLLIFILSAYFITVGIFFVFLCFYTSQPINMRFMIGFVYYFFGATIISSLIYCKFTKNKKDDSEFINNKMNRVTNLVIKFSVLIFSALFVIIGLFLAWKCISPGPAYESMPGIGALFFLGSLFIVGIMTFKVKNTKTDS
jgi:hypothetical protein